VQQISTEVQQIKEENAQQKLKLEEIKPYDLAYQKEKRLLDASVWFFAIALFLAPLVQAVSLAIGELANQLLRMWFKS